MFKRITCKLGNMRKAADFVLVPILEIAPEFIDVRSGLGVAALLAALRSHWITP